MFPSYPFYKANTSFFTLKVKMARKKRTEWRSAFYLFIFKLFHLFSLSLSYTHAYFYFSQNREAYPYPYTQCVKHTRIVICSQPVGTLLAVYLSLLIFMSSECQGFQAFFSHVFLKCQLSLLIDLCDLSVSISLKSLKLR